MGTADLYMCGCDPVCTERLHQVRTFLMSKNVRICKVDPTKTRCLAEITPTLWLHISVIPHGNAHILNTGMICKRTPEYVDGKYRFRWEKQYKFTAPTRVQDVIVCNLLETEILRIQKIHAKRSKYRYRSIEHGRFTVF